jgi:hypothetical protein
MLMMWTYWKIKTDTIKKITETLIDAASKEVGQEVNAEKTNYKLLFHHQNAGRNHDIELAKRYFENVTQFKIWEWQ